MSKREAVKEEALSRRLGFTEAVEEICMRDIMCFSVLPGWLLNCEAVC